MITETWATWAADYVGLPFEQHGRTRDGIDCYGLVLLVFREVFGISAPDFDLRESDPVSLRQYFNTGAISSSWKRVDAPRHGDVALVMVNGHPFHCGLMVGRTAMLHATGKALSAIERLDAPMWRNRIMGYYRFRGGLNAV